MRTVRKETQEGGLARVYVLVVRSGLATTRLVSSLHRIVSVGAIAFCLYCGRFGRWESIYSVLKGRKQQFAGGRGFVLAPGTTRRGKKALSRLGETGAGITQ